MNVYVPLSEMRLVPCNSPEAAAAENADPTLYCGCIVESEWGFCKHAREDKHDKVSLRSQTTRAKHRVEGALVYWMRK